jgi:hypothetical protein
MPRRPPHSQGHRHEDSDDPEAIRDMSHLMQEVNRTVPPWPRLDEEDIHGHSPAPPPPFHAHRDSVRVVAWAVSFVLGAVTIYGIAVGNTSLLQGELAVAAAWIFRLILVGRRS